MQLYGKTLYTADEVVGIKRHPDEFIAKGERYAVAVPRYVLHSDEQFYTIDVAKSDMLPRNRESARRDDGNHG